MCPSIRAPSPLSLSIEARHTSCLSQYGGLEASREASNIWRGVRLRQFLFCRQSD